MVGALLWTVSTGLTVLRAAPPAGTQPPAVAKCQARRHIRPRQRSSSMTPVAVTRCRLFPFKVGSTARRIFGLASEGGTGDFLCSGIRRALIQFGYPGARDSGRERAVLMFQTGQSRPQKDFMPLIAPSPDAVLDILTSEDAAVRVTRCIYSGNANIPALDVRIDRSAATTFRRTSHT